MNKLSFKDMHGDEVTVGDRIRIVSHYNYQFEQGKECDVVWDSEHGNYEYTYKEERRGKSFTTTSDFCGVHQFELITK